LDLGNGPLYAATFLSFAYLAGECLVYHTISPASLVPFIFIAGTYNGTSLVPLHPRNQTRMLIFDLIFVSCRDIHGVDAASVELPWPWRRSPCGYQ
jgi:hypothetical protein